MKSLSELVEIRQGMAMAGRAAGARPGDWAIRVIESSDIVEDHVEVGGLREAGVKRDSRSEGHLLRPFDVLVTARSQSVKVALVPPEITRTVASSTLLVLRSPHPGSGLPHYLWYYLTSTRGRAELVTQLTATSLPTLSAKAVGGLSVSVPPAAELRRLVDLIEATDVSRTAALEAARIRHDLVRDAIIGVINDGVPH